MVRLARIGRQRLLVASVAAVAALRGEERPLEGELLGEGGPPFVWDGCEWALVLEVLVRLRLDLRRSSPRSCTGYGLAARFFGRGGGTTAAWPDFSSFRKNFWAWLLTCHHHARLHLCAGHVQTLNSSAHDRKTDKAYPRVKEKS